VVYSVEGQVEAIVPDAVANRSDTEVVVEYKGARSSAVKIPVITRAPAIFTRDSSGKGQAAMLNQTGCCNSLLDPAMPGSIATMFVTGEGRPAWPVTVTVGNVPAEVLYANNVGMLVVNFRVPANAPAGDSVPLTLTVGDFRSIEGVTMAIRPASHRVLIIGSDPMLGPLTEILKRSGYEIVTTRDPQFDLVIADLATPLATIEAIRTTHAHIKIAIAADDATPTLLRAADILGANAVLTNSLTGETVLQRVAALLR
jgi:CheY-like chemotaxis protein